MGGIILLFIIVIGILIMKDISMDDKIIKKDCKLHKWYYRQDGCMECSECHKTPEEILRSLF